MAYWYTGSAYFKISQSYIYIHHTHVTFQDVVGNI